MWFGSFYFDEASSGAVLSFYTLWITLILDDDDDDALISIIHQISGS